MNFTDKWVTDSSGRKFVFTVEMQRNLHKAGLPVEPESLTKHTSVPAADTAQESHVIEDTSEAVGIQIDPETGKYIGALKWYNSTRGYGFVDRGNGEDIFFHKSSSLCDPVTLKEGEKLLYELEERARGVEAVEVEPFEH